MVTVFPSSKGHHGKVQIVKVANIAFDALRQMDRCEQENCPEKSISICDDDLVLRALVHEAHDGLDVDGGVAVEGGGE